MRGADGMAREWRASVGPAWVEIDLDAIAANVRAVRALLRDGCRLLAVVKANAYGHGAAEVGRAVLGAGAAGLGVSTVAEGLALRAAGIAAPILVFTPPRPDDLAAALGADLTLTVVSGDQALAVAAAVDRHGTPAVAHLKIDTGMGRYGVEDSAVGGAAAALAELAGPIRWEGVYTHFPRGADVKATRQQLQRFLAAVAAAERAGLHFAVRHAAASSAALAVPEARLDMVRIGNLLYGEHAGAAQAPPLRRAFALRVEAAQVRELQAGATVGYGSEVVLRRPTRVAVLPVGFADGLDMAPAGPYRRPRVLLRALARALLGAAGLARRLGAAAGDVRMGERPVPVLGRVGMQQVVVDCSAVPAEALDLPAAVHVRPTVVGAHLARVYLRDGVAVHVSTLAGSFATVADRASGERQRSV